MSLTMRWAWPFVVILGLLLLSHSVAVHGRSSGTAAAVDASDLLYVIGDVGATSARILVDKNDSSSPWPSTLFLRILEASLHDSNTSDNTAPVFTELRMEQVQVTPRAPLLVKVDALHGNRWYLLQVSTQSMDATPEHRRAVLRFRTMPEGDDDVLAMELLVVSCDRSIADHEDGQVVWHDIAARMEKHQAGHFGMAHLGDQIYADEGDRAIRVAPLSVDEQEDRSLQRKRFEAIADEYRAIYRGTFGHPVMQRVLRHGAHWMLPDDHEITNNFNFELVEAVYGESSKQQETLVKDEQRAKVAARRLQFRAGLQVLYEYQYQLHDDFPWTNVDFMIDSVYDILQTYVFYRTLEFPQIKMAFLDLRYDRSTFDPAEKEMRPYWIGHRQRRMLTDALNQWTKQDPKHPHSVVVFSSIPMFFHSPLSAKITYVVEREVYPGINPMLFGLRDLLHIMQPAVDLVVAGDIHMLGHATVCGATDSTGTRCLHQLITSGATHGSTAVEDVKLVPFYWLVTRLWPPIQRIITTITGDMFPLAHFDQVYLGRNYGVINISADRSMQWSSVTFPFDTQLQYLYQFLLDVFKYPVFTTIGAAMLLRRFLRHRQR